MKNILLLLILCVNTSAFAQNAAPVIISYSSNTINSGNSEEALLKSRLEKIYLSDLHCKKMMDSVKVTYGESSGEWKKCSSLVRVQHEENRRQVVEILDKYGWPGRKEVGLEGSMAVFLVLQNSDKATIAKYLPLLRGAAANGDAPKSSLAMMEDRFRMLEGKPQLYGSQVKLNAGTNQHELYEIEDELSVDKRRAAMGLGPLREYLKLFGIEYLPPKASASPH
ncbi:DUF6624 domain-containing protein [Pontibacter sp. SGAir0037]|uniref:DUF6624 domain-containing protein n=1 Tax=Pontibacter sp. SGAir0037 TaxID=2571030 RepID=UPI0010CD16CA|nr:DUF6624 domain-containing protein [Pontibacter sp. SGAir0037]QCR23519.1 hypothetical protein C1N53_14990 [Pontibacter sp. SGAir0037]